MRIIPAEGSKKLSVTALILALVCGWLAFVSSRQLYMAIMVHSTAGFKLSLSSAVVPLDMPPLAALAAYRPLAVYWTLALFWIAAAVISAGLLRRAAWARVGATALLYLLAGVCALGLLFPSLAVPKPLVFSGEEPFPEFNSAVRRAAFLLRLGCAAAGSLFLWWALLLDRGGLRAEFTPAGGTKSPPAPSGAPRPAPEA